MRIIVLLTIMSIYSLSASTSFSQNTKLSLNSGNITIKDLFTEIKKETDFSFLYNNNELDDNEVVVINSNNQTVEEVLNQVLHGKGLQYEIKDNFILVYKPESKSAIKNQLDENPKKKEIRGVVKDHKGEPIIGASITQEGTANGVITDIDGEFVITVPEKSKIKVLYLGYVTQEIAIKDQTFIELILQEDTQLLDEVVVVGYGTMKKSDLTGSITQISSKDFNKGIASSPDQLLVGKVPGLSINRSGGDPTGEANMQLRGPSSLTAGINPFYVIDGVPGASINLLSPDDIESINVLKDASSAAIYGSRAANGVIMVTTRRGKEGKPIVNYSSYAAVETVAGRVNVLSANEHRAFLAEHNMELAKSDDGYNTDWQDQLLRGAGFSQNHNLSLIGGTKTTKYNASVNFFDSQGIVKRNDYRRFVFRTGVDQSAFNDRLRIGLTLSGSSVKSSHVDYSIFNYAARFLPESPVKSDDPEYNQYDHYFQVPGRMTYYNPVGVLNQRDDKRSRNTFQATGKIGLDIYEGLVFDMLASMETENYDRARYQKRTDIGVIGKGYARREFLKNTDKLLETTLNYSKDFAEKHALKVMLGYSYERKVLDDGMTGTNNMFTSDELGSNNLGIGGGDAALHFQDYPTKKEAILVSFFGRLNYSFDSRYILTATLRRDGSSKFGANNKWAMFPSVSAAWRISGEKFMENQTLFQDLKLRFGYGKSGNQNVDPYSSLTLYGPQSSQFIYENEWINSYGVTQNPNPDLKWESTAMFNVGVDFSLLKGRLSGSIDLYNKKTDDMLYTYDVPSPPYQYNRLLANGASMTNKGVELMVNVVAYDNKDFGWNSSFNMSYNENEIGSLDSNIKNLSIAERYEGTMYLEGWTGQTIALVKPGKPLGTFFTYKYRGYDEKEQKTLYENKDGEIVTIDKLNAIDDYHVVGQALPKINYGWNNTFRYKQFDFSFFVRGVLGNKIFNASRADLSRLTQATITNLSKDAVKDGIMEAPQPSSRWLEKGDFLRMENMTLGYQFDTSKWKGIDRLRIYATAENLFVITKYTGVDPEVSLSGLAPGIDNRNYYPKTRSFMLGVNLSF